MNFGLIQVVPDQSNHVFTFEMDLGLLLVVVVIVLWAKGIKQ